MKVLHISTFERAGGAAIAASRLHEGCASSDTSRLSRARLGRGQPVPGTIGLAGLECPRSVRLPSISSTTTRFQRYALRVSTICSPVICRRATSRRSMSCSRQTSSMSIGPRACFQRRRSGRCRTLASQLSGRCMTRRRSPVVATTRATAAAMRPTATMPSSPADAAHLPALVLDVKRQWLDAARLTVVTPSAWLASCARASSLLRDADVRVIPIQSSSCFVPERVGADARARLQLPT